MNSANPANPANTHCPWSGDPVSADAITTYRQHPVAFCNPGCRDKFERATLHFDTQLPAAAAGPPPFYTRAVYNGWINERLLKAIDQLSEEDYRRDLGACFGSIHLTMNHLMVWDMTWLKRLAERFRPPALESLHERPWPRGHDEQLCEHRAALRAERTSLDGILLAYSRQVGAQDAAQVLEYGTRGGARVRKRVDGVLTHLFNHQTHHRGQVTTLLSQLGGDPGATDLLLTLEDY